VASQSIPLLLILLPLAALIVGVVLTWLGWRGRQVDNHPICRRCGFDLFGLAELTKCPECGTELSASKIRLGHRKVRAIPLAGGLAMLLPAVVVLGAVTFAAIKHVDVNRYKPVWWLLREADAPALIEVYRRLATGQLSTSQIDHVTAAALAAQADMSRPFLVEWGTIVERARSSKNVSDESWKRYARQAIPLKLVARANVRRGDPVPVHVHYGPVRLGRGYLFRTDIAVVRSSLGAAALTGATRTGMGVQFGDGGTDLNCKFAIAPDDLKTLPDGPNRLDVTLRVKMLERFKPPPSTTDKEVTSDEVTVSTTLNLVPTDQPTVEVVSDPSLRDAVESSVVLRGYRISNMYAGFAYRGGGRHVIIAKDRDGSDQAQFMIDAQRPPIALASDVVVVDPAGREWPLYPITIEQGSQGGHIISGHWDGFGADRVDVVLRPNPAAAAETVGITRIWGGSVRFKNVAVVWDKEAKRPTTRPASARQRQPATTTSSTTRSIP
jgi:hypothetical protein